MYTKEIDDILFDWLKNFLEESGDKILNIETVEEKDELISFLVYKTNELFKKIIKKNNYKISSIKSVFLICFFITYKTFIDNSNLNMKCLSKAIPETNITDFKKIEVDILKLFNWVPFKLSSN
jgi:hypothetical protein